MNCVAVYEGENHSNLSFTCKVSLSDSLFQVGNSQKYRCGRLVLPFRFSAFQEQKETLAKLHPIPTDLTPDSFHKRSQSRFSLLQRAAEEEEDDEDALQKQQEENQGLPKRRRVSVSSDSSFPASSVSSSSSSSTVSPASSSTHWSEPLHDTVREARGGAFHLHGERSPPPSTLEAKVQAGLDHGFRSG